MRREGNRIRITAQLIEVESDSHLWAEVYDRQVGDTFAIQKEISDDIVRGVASEVFVRGRVSGWKP